MPTPNFLPVIARDIPGLVQQQYEWARFNAPIDAANAQSFANAASQANQYQWMRDQAIAQQTQSADQLAAKNAADLYFFNRQSEEQSKRYQDEKAAQEKLLKLEQDKLNAASKIKDINTDQDGTVAAGSMSRLATAFNFLKKAYEDADAQLRDYNNRMGSKDKPLTPGDMANRLMLEKSLPSLLRDYERASNELSRYKSDLLNKGYEVGEGVISRGGKSWKFSDEVKKAAAQPAWTPPVPAAEPVPTGAPLDHEVQRAGTISAGLGGLNPPGWSEVMRGLIARKTTPAPLNLSPVGGGVRLRHRLTGETFKYSGDLTGMPDYLEVVP